MRKIPSELENPFDNIVIELSEPMSQLFHKMHLLPNHITTFSLIFGLIAVYTLYKGKVWLTVVFMVLSYWMDCIDGYYARKYNMVTQFGDFYDHVKDTTVFIMFIIVLYMRNRNKLSTRYWILTGTVLFLFALSFGVYFACQERYYDRLDDIPSLAWLANFIKCKDAAKKCLYVFRFMGLGTFMITILGFTVWIENKK